MLTGVEILLERMKTNPEEFLEGALSKWSRVIDYSWQVLTEEERNALQNGMKEAKREHFNGEVMRVLAQGHDDEKEIVENYLTKKGKVISSKNMAQQAKQILSNEFDKAYAKQEGDKVAWWDGTLPRDIYK